MSKRETILQKGENIFSSDNEQERLKVQQQMLYDYDMQIIEKFIDKNKPICVLDLGCNNCQVGLSRLEKFNTKAYIGVDVIDNSEMLSENNNLKNAYLKGAEFSYCVANLEEDTFEDKLLQSMAKCGVEKFDVVFCFAIFAHLKEPAKVLTKVKKFCNSNCLFFIRNIDDGFNICSGSKLVERGIKFLDKTKFTGFRYSGRQVNEILIDAGFKEINLVKTGIDTIGMNKEKRLALFHTIFDFILISLRKEKDLKILNSQNEKRLNWLEEMYEEIGKEFLKDRFFLHFGFMFYVARIG